MTLSDEYLTTELSLSLSHTLTHTHTHTHTHTRMHNNDMCAHFLTPPDENLSQTNSENSSSSRLL